MDNFKTLMEIQELKDLLQDEVSKLKPKQDGKDNENYILKGEIKMMNKIIPILNDIILNKY
tara:strand:- start:295 stop:477 length:183 start_codon:yes stop_codon:yes gene_type:complete